MKPSTFIATAAAIVLTAITSCGKKPVYTISSAPITPEEADFRAVKSYMGSIGFGGIKPANDIVAQIKATFDAKFHPAVHSNFDADFLKPVLYLYMTDNLTVDALEDKEAKYGCKFYTLVKDRSNITQTEIVTYEPCVKKIVELKDMLDRMGGKKAFRLVMERYEEPSNPIKLSPISSFSR